MKLQTKPSYTWSSRATNSRLQSIPFPRTITLRNKTKLENYCLMAYDAVSSGRIKVDIEVHSTSSATDAWSFLGIKQSVGGADHPAPSNANVAIPPPPVCACTGRSRGSLSLLCCLHLQNRSLYKKFPFRTFGFVTAISHACHLKANGVCDRCGSGVRSTNDQLYYSDYVKRITNEPDP